MLDMSDNSNTLRHLKHVSLASMGVSDELEWFSEEAHLDSDHIAFCQQQQSFNDHKLGGSME